MKKIYTILIVVVFFGLSTNVKSQTPYWEWARQATSPNPLQDWSEGWSIATDRSENVYITGFYKDTVTFGNYTFSCPQIDHGNIYLVKYDSAGNLLWAWSAGGSGDGIAVGVATDNFGNVFLTARSQDSAYLIFGSDTLYNNVGYDDIVIAKFNSSGNVLWAHIIGGTTQVAMPFQITTDALGNSYITGYFQSPSLTFGSHTINSLGGGTLFLVKYDSLGNAIWVRGAGGNGGVIGYGVTTDNNENVYVTGSTSCHVTHFGNDSIVGPGTSEFFIAKYDSSGQILWIRNSTGTGDDCWGYWITADPFGNTYSTGMFSYTPVTFGSITLTTNSGISFFIVKYDSIGNVLWAKCANGDETQGYSVVSDTCGNAYVLGQIQTTASSTFDTITLQPPIGSVDPMFLVKYNSSGQIQYGYVFPSGGDDNNALAIGPSGSIYITGDFAVNEIIGPDTLIVTDYNELAFVAKLNNHPVCIETGISELKQQQQSISIYPNPATTLLNIHHSTCTSPETLLITDLLGTAIYQQPINNSTQSTIDISTWSAGIYFYCLTPALSNGEGVSVRGKFVKE